ncbi:hypothetical protein SK128_014938 [Halocaridina rubra]|uniref:Fatty acid hydroxylase domain-containing protein n=1 Tax=Halocaridina rubra TaxID=373956 RepID=A0AAN8ZXE5_HALRR
MAESREDFENIVHKAMGEQTLLERILGLLYILNPKKAMFEHASEVPNYVDEALVIFFLFMVLEALFRRFVQNTEVRFNEGLCSIALGILHESVVFVSGTIMFLGYEWLYQYRAFDLPWNALYTWFAAFVFIDFGYYWIHRANHEINILWAVHQVHHSSEDYNLTIALRISLFQRAAYFGFYQPLALIGFPFSMVLVHAAFNYLFQFWVHTDLIRHIGPLEFVFMSPSHHRVHHGSNKWCLDKNYASVFVLWDRIFGTFEEERKDDEIVYGLTDQPQTHNAIYMEFFYFKVLYDKAKSMKTWADKLRAFFYGPGWVPGAPRLGDPATFPDIKAPRAKYDPYVPLWKAWYLMIHLFIVFLCQQLLLHQMSNISWSAVAIYLLCIFISIGIVGGLVDNRWWAPLIESTRCAAFVGYAWYTPITHIYIIDTFLTTYFVGSMILWAVRSTFIIAETMKPRKTTSKLK